MITNIKLNDVASYKSIISIDTNAKINLFYGLNGSGKTTISRFLRDPSSPEFSKCGLYPDSIETEKEFYIYNQDYINENFHQNTDQKGIFTVGKDSIDAERRIEEIGSKLVQVENIQKNVIEKKNLISEHIEEEKQRLQDFLYKEYKQKYERTGLSRCLKGNMGTKVLFLNKIKATQYKPNLDYTFKELLEVERDLQNSKGISLNALPTLDEARLDSTIKNILWETSYINSGSSNLNKVITELGNLRWVQEGMNTYLKEGQEKCPFCQEKLPTNFDEELKRVFDDSYNEAQDSINKHKEAYEESVRLIKKKIDEISEKTEFFKYIDQSVFNFQCRELYALLDSNEKLIIKKQENPSLSVSLLDISRPIEKLKFFINEANELIQEFNRSIVEFSDSEKRISNQFWELIRCESNSMIEECEGICLTKTQRKELYKKQLLRLHKIHQRLEEQKQQELAKTTNTDESKEKINAHLRSLGVEGFSLGLVEEGSGNSYRIVRPETDQFIFKTLSEGEKTIITFIYFLESVLGVDPDNESLNLQNRIVVIDDPISSLSHNYIYDIARLIKKVFIEKKAKDGQSQAESRLIVGQLFILTHSLYFFHEIIKQKVMVKGGRKLFRVTKNYSSEVVSIHENDIQNGYQEYWVLFKKATEDSLFVSILPNVMRNILEEFFSFIHQRAKLKVILEELSDNDDDFMPLERYINRESHSDLTNLTRFREIPSDKYREMFRRIFEKSGHSEHYQIMMGG